MKLKPQRRNQLLQDNLGIVVKLVLRYWSSLPVYAAVSYDISDMVQDVTIRVLEALSQYDPSRGRLSTFIWHVAENHCRELVGRWKAGKRFAVDVLPMETLFTSARAPEDESHMLPARDALEAVLAQASQDLRRVFERFCRSRCKPIWKPEMREEFRSLALQCGLTPQDLKTVLTRLL